MQNPYSEIFRAPGAKGFAAAGFMARLPIAMAPIGIVAMLSQDAWGILAGRRGLAHHDHLGARFRRPDCCGQPGLAGMDAVRVGAAGGGDAQHPGNGARSLDRDFSRTARDEHRIRLRVGCG